MAWEVGDLALIIGIEGIHFYSLGKREWFWHYGGGFPGYVVSGFFHRIIKLPLIRMKFRFINYTEQQRY
jgi:hypothetical protein